MPAKTRKAELRPAADKPQPKLIERITPVAAADPAAERQRNVNELFSSPDWNAALQLEQQIGNLEHGRELYEANRKLMAGPKRDFNRYLRELRKQHATAEAAYEATPAFQQMRAAQQASDSVPPKPAGRKPTMGAHVMATDPFWSSSNPDVQNGQLCLWVTVDDCIGIGIDRFEYIYLKRKLAELRGIEFTAESEVMDQALPGESVENEDEATEAASA